MKKNLIIIIGAILFAALAVSFLTNNSSHSTKEIFNAALKENIQPKPLAKYAIPELKKATFTPSDITIGKTIDLQTGQEVRQFFFSDSFAPSKKISGTITLPQQPGTYPVLILFRGWADENIYYPGYGTKNAAAYFAKRGYITIAPDFLGYGDSDSPSTDLAEGRFQSYTAAITLLDSISNFNPAFEQSDLPYSVDASKVGIWGHSNGGHIALTLLIVTGKSIPTTLWAPVTIPFPENVLHYSADQDDGGALIRGLVQAFKLAYDVEKYDITNYFSDIRAPIILHQGTADDSVPQEWNDSFARAMEGLGKDITYYTYPGTDHNLSPGWGTVIARDTKFFDEKLK